MIRMYMPGMISESSIIRKYMPGMISGSSYTNAYGTLLSLGLSWPRILPQAFCSAQSMRLTMMSLSWPRILSQALFVPSDSMLLDKVRPLISGMPFCVLDKTHTLYDAILHLLGYPEHMKQMRFLRFLETHTLVYFRDV